MAVKRVKLKAHEQVTPQNIKKVIALLENGGTKKQACETLNIKYNTTRLSSIIEDYEKRTAAEKALRAKKAGTPVGLPEALDIIKEYLETASVEAVSRTFYRSTQSINRVLEEHGAKLYNIQSSYFDPLFLPDHCFATSFKVGQYVWAARFNMLAQVKKEHSPGVYAIRVLGKYERDSYQKAEDLGSLEYLESIGLQLNKINFFEKHIETDED